jgi:hypothetical protein
MFKIADVKHFIVDYLIFLYLNRKGNKEKLINFNRIDQYKNKKE